jgi:methylation protein EvaC
VNCRICETELVENIDFGPMAIANNFVRDRAKSLVNHFHMRTGICPKCFCYQLVEQPAAEAMFNADYPFFTSTSSRMVAHFQSVWHKTVKGLMGPGDLVVEIGSNDGSFLANAVADGFPVLGIEPSKSVHDAATARGVRSINEFFSIDLSRRLKSDFGKAKVIFGANVICHIPNALEIFGAAESLLDDDGWFIFEEPYLRDVLALNSFDQIYDEHVFLFSAGSVSEIARRTGLFLQRVDRLPNHGGSARYYLTKRNKAGSAGALAEEKADGLQDLRTYESFGQRVRSLRTQIPAFLGEASRKHGTLYGYGATSKSTTINRYCGIDDRLVKKIYDVTPNKVNTFAPGSGIPVRSFEERAADDPQCFVLYAWNHKAEIREKERAFIDKGGVFVEFFPGPTYC